MEDEILNSQEQLTGPGETQREKPGNLEPPAGTPLDRSTASHKTREELEAALETIRRSPKLTGSVELIVCRPGTNERRELDSAELSIETGLHGDNWKSRHSSRGSANTDMQVTLMNSRAIGAIAKRRADWALAGDQLYVDFDLSDLNVPPGTRLRVGSAVLEVTAEPHLRCRKFSERFGKDAVLFVNSNTGKSLSLRGINARVVSSGSVSRGDAITKF